MLQKQYTKNPRDFSKLLQERDTRGDPDSFTLKTRHYGSQHFELISNYFKNKTQKVPEIVSNYFKNKTQGVPKILSNYFKNWRRKIPEIPSNYFKNKIQVIPEILSNYVLQKQTTKRPRDAFKLLQKLEIKISEILSHYILLKQNIRSSLDPFEVLQKKKNHKRSPRFFQIILKTKHHI